MIDASTYKVLAELSKSGRFRFVKDKENNTLLAGEDEGKISFEIHLIEDIEVVKLTVTTQTPKGATYVTSVSDSIAGKDRLDIYRVFEKLGKLAAVNMLSLVSKEK